MPDKNKIAILVVAPIHGERFIHEVLIKNSKIQEHYDLEVVRMLEDVQGKTYCYFTSLIYTGGRQYGKTNLNNISEHLTSHGSVYIPPVDLFTLSK
jgi:hypothetical protein